MPPKCLGGRVTPRFLSSAGWSSYCKTHCIQDGAENGPEFDCRFDGLTTAEHLARMLSAALVPRLGWRWIARTKTVSMCGRKR